jgi:hypothetical protein
VVVVGYGFAAADGFVTSVGVVGAEASAAGSSPVPPNVHHEGLAVHELPDLQPTTARATRTTAAPRAVGPYGNRCDADAVIMKLPPDGIHTPLQERGNTIPPGGESTAA